MFGAIMVALLVSCVATIAIRIALIKSVDPDFPLISLFSGDQSIFISRNIINAANEKKDRSTIVLIRAYKITRYIFISLFVLALLTTLWKNLI